MDQEYQIKIGMGIMIFKDGKVLLGRRIGKSENGVGEWAFPGGKLDYMESVIEGASREVWEETGITISNVRLLYVGTLRRYPPNHYLQIQLIADWESGDPEVREPEKHESWGWYEFEVLPTPLYATVINSLDAYRTGRNLYEE